MDDTSNFTRKTLRATVIVTMVSLIMLANFGCSWVILPLLAGLALAVVLWLGWWGFIHFVVVAHRVSPATFQEKTQGKRRTTRLFLWFALVKYPLVGALIWWLTRVWTARDLAGFVAGFLILHGVIARSWSDS